LIFILLLHNVLKRVRNKTARFRFFSVVQAVMEFEELGEVRLGYVKLGYFGDTSHLPAHSLAVHDRYEKLYGGLKSDDGVRSGHCRQFLD
jgi:hypothetical protein